MVVILGENVVAVGAQWEINPIMSGDLLRGGKLAEEMVAKRVSSMGPWRKQIQYKNGNCPAYPSAYLALRVCYLGEFNCRLRGARKQKDEDAGLSAY